MAKIKVLVAQKVNTDSKQGKFFAVTINWHYQLRSLQVTDLPVLETNRYVQQYTDNNVIPPHSPVNHWRATDCDEMYMFLSLTDLMGIIYKPRLSMHLSPDELHETGIFGKSIARDCYLLMLCFLHFVNILMI